MPEAICTWSGWSLAAPRPGSVLQRDSMDRTNETQKRTNIPLTASFAAEPQSLPVLRYGTEYRFRILAVDLAGNSIDFGDPTDLFGAAPPSDPVRFLRYEPIPPPTLLLRHPRTEGEAVERIVVRSDYNTPDAQVTPVERHIAPPRTSQLTAELHGMFDANGGLDRTAQARIGALDAFDLEHSPQAVVEPTRPGDDPGQHSYTYDVDQIDVEYLPDPMAAGVLFQDVPSGAGQVEVQMMFTGATPWPARRAGRIRVQQGTGAPAIVTEGGVDILVVQVPRGATRTMRYRSLVPPDQILEQHGVLPLVDHPIGGVTAQQRSAARSAILHSRAWMVTPDRPITLVNATKRPTLSPQVTITSLDRQPGAPVGDLGGATSATFAINLGFNRPSTSKVEMTARWDAMVDSGLPLDDIPPGANPTSYSPPVSLRHSGHAFDVPLTADPADTSPGVIDRAGLVHRVGDTKHHLIDYQGLATTAYAEYFVQRRTITLADTTTAVAVDAAGFVVGHVRVTSPDRTFELQLGVDVEIDHAHGTVKRLRDVTAAAGGPSITQVEVAYVTPDITLTGADLLVHVASTAAPPPPKVQSVLPTFKWSSGGDGVFVRSSSRNGRGLRVWLDRPWYASGEDEMLGVILPQAASPASTLPDPALTPYITQYGTDPISGGSTVRASAAAPADFTLRNTTLSRDDVFLRELGQTVRVAAHKVEFDTVRAQYCADIEVSGVGGYLPFVRLALARFQPYSLAGLELSGVVLADFIQLTPDRTLQVNYDLSNPSRVNVQLSGEAHTSIAHAATGAVESLRPKLRVWVEKQDIAGAGDLSWAPVKGAVPVELTGKASLIPLSTTTIWSGTVTLAGNRFTVPQRLVVEEYEQRDFDDRGDGADRRRITYTDYIRL